MTNAFVHATGPVRLSVDHRNNAVVISVQDATPSLLPHQVMADDESGRGLKIVHHLACSFGCNTYAHHKVVWPVLEPSATEFEVAGA